mgnify:FL=1
MSDNRVRLHEIDLGQIEKVKKLVVRLTADLQHWEQFTGLIASQEAGQEYVRLGMRQQGENEPTPEVVAARLVSDQEKLLVSIKSAIWNTSNSLKQDHERRQVLKAQILEQDELKEA